MSKIKIDKISLRIGKKKEIELSLEEARELQRVLADLLGVEGGNRTTVIPSAFSRWDANTIDWFVGPSPVWVPSVWTDNDNSGTAKIGITSVSYGTIPK